MNVGVVGCGKMGRALGGRAAAAGHAVTFGSRATDFAQETARAAGHGALGGSYAQAVARAEIVLLATRWQQTFEALAQAGSWKGKTVLDATNPSSPDGLALILGHATSGAEEIANAIPQARVVKAFNHVYAEVVAGQTRFGGVAASVFYCGNDAEANSAAGQFIRGLGFDPVFAGALPVARYLEPAAQLMVAVVEGQRHPPTSVALGLLRNPPRPEARA